MNEIEIEIDEPEPEPTPAQPAGRRRLSVRKRIAFALVLLLAPLLLLEGALRVMGWPTGRIRTVKKLVNFDSGSFNAGVGMFRPGAQSRVSWPPQLAYTVRINALGLRGPEVALEPPADKTRILALGDSMTFGYYVEQDQTFPARLQAELVAGSWEAVEVVNGGAGGWSIEDQARFVEERALKLKPDVVTLNFCANDIADLQRPRCIYQTQIAELDTHGGLKPILYGTAIYELVLRGKIALKRRRLERAGKVPHPLSSVDVPEAKQAELWKRYAEWLDRLHAALRAQGIPLVVCYLPDAYKLKEKLPATDEARLRALCNERSISFVSPLGAFVPQDPHDLFHIPLDSHLNAAGLDLVAKTVARHLLQNRAKLTPKRLR